MSKGCSGLMCALLLLSFIIISWTAKTGIATETTEKKDSLDSAGSSAPVQQFSKYIADIFETARLSASGLDMGVFQKAVIGYCNLKLAGKLPQSSSVITVVDFNKSSCSKRMWIIDLQKKILLLNTWVAHGNGSGDDVPSYFSNEQNSFASSLGFYVTDNVYNGKHGKSLRLDGMDEGFNDQALKRDIVVHAAPYVCEGSINQLGRLGRSEGCPAVSPKVVNKVIDAIKGKTVLFINADDSNYNSKYLDENLAANFTFGNSSNQSALTASL